MSGKGRSVIEGGYQALQAEINHPSSVAHTHQHTKTQEMCLKNVCCFALKCTPTGIPHNMCQVQNYTFLCMCACLCYVTAFIDILLALGAICFQRCVVLFVYVSVCACDTGLVHVTQARTLSRSLSYMPGFGLCLNGSVIIQIGKQPASDLISCLESHRERWGSTISR